ncbi:regulator of microtubule dynamics protein 2-like [Gordionus sp. m RMFG-2023]|uniref:regulator of microtubule dynamics protein 2-like n=1 Tax=Gordionus sp. m RMFG-2023 TaxID=3053472 RepID=UPI0031FDD451
MDNTNSKLSLIIVASSACAAVIASAYLLYQLNQKDDQIVKLKKEIQRLSHQINKNSMNNNEIINHNTHYNRKSQHLKNRLNNGINHVCNDQNHLNNGLIANNFNKSKKNVRFLSMEERQNNHDATDAKPIHYDNGMYAFSKSSSENLLLYTNNELNKFESNSILSDAGGEDEFFDTIESLSNLESSCQVILNDIKNLESKGDINYILVYNLLSQCEFKEPEFYCAKAKFSRYMARIEEENENEEQSKHYFFEAHKFSKIAETLDPDNTEVKKWCAITLGDLSEYVSISDRVKNALIVKHYAESCLMEDQNDPLVHYLLGRWHFKVVYLLRSSSLLKIKPTGSLHKQKIPKKRESVDQTDWDKITDVIWFLISI